MKYCGQCGQQLSDGDRFCSACGAVSPEPEEAATAAMGQEMPSAAPMAGESKEAGLGTGPDTPRQPDIFPISAIRQGKGSAGGRKKAVIIGSVAVLLLVAGGLWGWWSRGAESRAQAKLDLAVKYLSENKFEEAALAYSDVIKIDPKRADAYKGLGVVYSLQGKSAEAEKALQEGLAKAIDVA